MKYQKSLASVLIILGCVATSFCKVSLPDILSDGMVLQRNAPVPIWGSGEVGEAVTITFGNQTKKTLTGKNGNWHVKLEPMTANAIPQALTIKASNTIILQDILIGEVWLCSGQSNMQWEVQQSDGGDAAIAEADYPTIRLFSVDREVGYIKNNRKIGEWSTANSETVKTFSAVGYYFALELMNELGIPVGMINSSYGGTQAEAWTPRDYLRVPALQACIDREITWAAERDSLRIVYEKKVVRWKKKVAKAKANGTRIPGKPRVPNAIRPQRIAGSLYENMIEPLIPFSIKGALWYQGESNVERAEQYELLLTTMIRSWRDQWRQGDFPFGIVQLPGYKKKSDVPVDEAWGHLRDRQLKVVEKTKHTGLIVTIDIGETKNIHPVNKVDVSKRLFMWAMANVYGKKIQDQGPLYDKVKFKKGKAIVYFKETNKGLKTTDGLMPKDFAISGSDQQWVWAKAKIKGKKKIIVWSDDIRQPMAVRYAFNNNPNNANITNDTGIPASPFRTDSWAGPTAGKQ